jgi:DNA polymerase II small subunit/DNA polymerase delta subunit B
MEEMTLNKDQTEKKRTIVNKLVNSGINITPSILEFVLNLEKPMEDLNLIIKETSFIPDFKSHLTEKVLTKISNDQIQKVLKRKAISPKAHINENKMKNRDLPTIVSDNLNLKKLREDPNPLAAPYNNQLIQIKKISQSDSNTSLTNDISIEKKIEVKPFGSTKSSFAFNPIAKQYSSDYKILTDPTGKLFTTGEYEDFYDYTVDKFNKLRMMMRKRSDVLSATNINNILRLTNSAEVSTIGLVSNMHQTKNNNYLFNLEDLTGIVNVLVRKDSEKEENFKTIQRTVNDQMVYVEGTYSPGEKGKKGIIFVNYITKIDIPTDFKPSISTDPLSIALISDTHIGSKEFEETLLKRFINFLNGKIGDKNIRKISLFQIFISNIKELQKF